MYSRSFSTLWGGFTVHSTSSSMVPAVVLPRFLWLEVVGMERQVLRLPVLGTGDFPRRTRTAMRRMFVAIEAAHSKR